ncbi:TssN family type VI secretion system protein [Aridibaculum aurantiacum]|uniref:TssN family type VI secretion system protein n=1 Tax=Aridibaculum aurantiacum TaxID=2810307 RepID=UPI001A97164E|nr:TssN family type VI secretion system protein [Aridibaculum aurantiacum]
MQQDLALENNPERSTSFAWLHAPFIIIANLSISSILFFQNFTLNNWYITLATLVVLYIASGILHATFQSSSTATFSYKTSAGVRKTLLFSIGNAVAIAALISSINNQLIWLSIVATASFFAPNLILHTYNYFLNIPVKQYPLWYKRRNLIENKAFVFLASVPLKIKVAPKSSDTNLSTFTCTAPAQMELGRVFHYFIVQQLREEVDIETEDEAGQSFGWQFYIRTFGGYRLTPLHPEKNLWENQVKPNATIVAKRVTTELNMSLSNTSIKEYELFEH